jgi:kynurenine formamidase
MKPQAFTRTFGLGAILAASLCMSGFGSGPARAEMSLADAYKVIAGKQMVDLTHTFGVNSPVWSGFGQATMAAAADPVTHEAYTIEKSGFHTTYYAMVGQYGTHIDPPAHFAPGGMTMDKIPLDEMFLPLVVLDDTKYMKDDPNHAFTVDDLKAWEAEHGQVPEGAFAALRTDMSKDWSSDPEHFKRYPFPAWSFEVIKFLFDERGVTAIGHEALDTDVTEMMESETWLLNQGHFQIEVMDNLDKVPATGAVIFVTWPKVENGLGFPARAIAILP